MITPSERLDQRLIAAHSLRARESATALLGYLLERALAAFAIA